MTTNKMAGEALRAPAPAQTYPCIANSTAHFLSNSIQAFAAAMVARGIVPPANLVADGNLHRCAVEGKSGKTDAAYCLHLDGLPAGGFENWCDGLGWENWHAERAHPLTPAERKAVAQRIEAMRQQREAEQHRRYAQAAARNAVVSAQCVQICFDDPPMRYLERRGLGDGRLPACLRLHPALPYWHEGELLGTFPAMIAPLVDLAERVLAMHRTYLTKDGTKAPVPQVKKLTRAAGPLAGACIPLAAPLHGVLGIAEGIENALAAMQGSGLPVVSAASASLLAAWKWPVGVRRLVIFADADADDAGRKAADKLRTRAFAAGLAVQVLTPSITGTDWADVWAAREGDAS